MRHSLFAGMTNRGVLEGSQPDNLKALARRMPGALLGTLGMTTLRIFRLFAKSSRMNSKYSGEGRLIGIKHE
jgi:hypothetical protein